MREHVWHITGINPEPWVAPEHALGRRNGGYYVQVYSSDTLRSYKKAIAEEIRLQNNIGAVPPFPEGSQLDVTFYLYRQLDASESAARSTRRGHADATNCQKALEDALQGILYHNDKANRSVHTVMVEQDQEILPHIIIVIREFDQTAVRVALVNYPRPKYSNQPKSNIDTTREGMF